jgi:phosphinothricin acetyltransferase
VDSALAIRSGKAADIPRITEIYNHYVANTAISFDIEPWSTEKRLSSWFSQYSESGPYRLLVAELNGQAIGYASSSQFRSKAAYCLSVETSIYIDPSELGKGFGTQLYRALLEQLAATDLHRAYGGVTLPNEASIGLHKKLGFKEVGVFSQVGYKFGQYYDVCWLEKALP